MNNHPIDADVPEPAAGQNLSRTVFEYHYLRRRLLELHSAEHRNIVAIDAVMRRLDEMRSSVRAAPPAFGSSAAVHAPAHTYR
jgi:hypothetical protein